MGSVARTATLVSTSADTRQGTAYIPLSLHTTPRHASLCSGVQSPERDKRQNKNKQTKVGAGGGGQPHPTI